MTLETILPAPLAPITEFNLTQIFGWYVVYYTLASLSTSLVTWIIERQTGAREIDDESHFSLRSVLMAGPTEEMGFRGLAVGVMTLGGIGYASSPEVFFVGLMIMNGIWSGIHNRGPAVLVFTFVLGLYFSRFWMEGFDGLWWVAVLMHMFHNAFVTFSSPHVERELDPRRRRKPW